MSPAIRPQREHGVGRVGGDGRDGARRRAGPSSADLWLSATRGYVDPTFLLTDIEDEVEAAARDFEAAGEVDALLEATLVQCLIHLNSAHWAETAKAARRGLDLATTYGRERRQEDFADWLTNALCWGQTHATEGIAIIEAMLPLARRRLTQAWMIQAISFLRAILGDGPGSGAGQLEAQAIWDELGQRPNDFRHAWARFVLDDLDGALLLAQAQSDDFERRGETGQRSTMVALIAWIFVLQGRDADGDLAAEESRRLGSLDDAVTQTLWRVSKCIVLARRGDIEEADRISRECVEIADGTDSMDAGTAWLARAEVLGLAGRRQEAADAARRARDLYVSQGLGQRHPARRGDARRMSLVVTDAAERHRYEARA